MCYKQSLCGRLYHEFCPQKKTLVVDFSVLPERPKLNAVQCPTKKIAIPIYVDDDIVDFRIHDLPPDMSNMQIAEAMLQYGEVLTIRDEVWRDIFAGLPNGVRVIKMKLTKPVLSFVTICGLQVATLGLSSLVTHTDRSSPADAAVLNDTWPKAAQRQPRKTRPENQNKRHLPLFCLQPIQQQQNPNNDFMDFVLEERLHLNINEEAIEDDPADVRFVTGRPGI
ncbi:conserved hypothetical protein [Culex quinquefasciatus]|uniref:Uncharacterized protein n=1 Tax=Culex quinquefasciatus TaxID=7176 RepID=B0XBX5_CULQU|nr:conserved hypothetical protein [Culex quinquefasciatus]|eukprot:XP_001867147.1 conserved hypothetical protein [Culex quinquefasciatus]